MNIHQPLSGQSQDSNISLSPQVHDLSSSFPGAKRLSIEEPGPQGAERLGEGSMLAAQGPCASAPGPPGGAQVSLVNTSESFSLSVLS